MTDQPQLPEAIQKYAENIPALPAVMVRVIQLTRNHDTSAKELTQVINQDPALTGNILKLCNSAFYGLPRVVASLSQAIMYLGFYTVRNLVLTCSMRNIFEVNSKTYGYEENGLWRHSIACAIVSELICEKLRPDLRDAGFTAALLHDIGQLVIALSIKDTSDSILELMTENNLSDWQAEKEVIGISHDVLGGIIADNWNYPDELIHAIRYHHKPFESKNPAFLTSVVHLADSISLQLGYGLEAEQMKFEPHSSVLQTLSINSEAIDIFTEQAQYKIEERSNLFMDEI